jgi:hypothetical protein
LISIYIFLKINNRSICNIRVFNTVICLCMPDARYCSS